MYKQVENYFVNEVISDLVTTMCQTRHYNTKIYELPQLSVKSVVLQDLDTKQVVDKDLANGVVHEIHKNLLVTMQFNISKQDIITVIYNTQNQEVAITSNEYQDLIKHDEQSMHIPFDKYLRFRFACNHPDLLFFELDADLIANKIVTRYTKLQKQGKRAKQLAVAK